MISAMVAPSRVIELGCFTGYSTLCLAEGLRPDGQLHTVEINDEDADELSERFASDPRIHLHIGDALEILSGEEKSRMLHRMTHRPKESAGLMIWLHL